MKDSSWGKVPPDGGWGYGAVIGMVQAMLLFGLAVRSYGVIYLITLERFETSATVAAWVGATNILVYGIFSPVAAILCNRYSCRMVAAVGTMFLVSGFILTAFAFHVSIMYISFGLLGGIGISCTSNAAFIIVTMYFDVHRALAISIGSAGASISVFIMPPLINFLYDYYGYRGCMLILAGISLQGLVSAFLFKPLDKYDRPKILPNKDLTQSQEKSPNTTKHMPDGKESQDVKHIPESDIAKSEEEGVSESLLEKSGISTEQSAQNSEKLKKSDSSSAENLKAKEAQAVTVSKLDIIKDTCSNVKLLGIILINIGMTIVATSANTFAPAQAVDTGISQTLAVLLLSWAGLADTIGRIAIGAIMDKLRRYRMWIYTGCTVIGSIAVFMYPLIVHYGWYTLSMVLYEGNIGVCFAQRTTILADAAGMKKMPILFGFLQLVNALGIMFGRGIGGIVKDQTDTYVYVFYLSGIISLSLCAIMIAILIKQHRNQSGEEQQQQKA